MRREGQKVKEEQKKREREYRRVRYKEKGEIEDR